MLSPTGEQSHRMMMPVIDRVNTTNSVSDESARSHGRVKNERRTSKKSKKFSKRADASPAREIVEPESEVVEAKSFVKSAKWAGGSTSSRRNSEARKAAANMMNSTASHANEFKGTS